MKTKSSNLVTLFLLCNRYCVYLLMKTKWKTIWPILVILYIKNRFFFIARGVQLDNGVDPLCNIYATTGKWEEVSFMCTLMQVRGKCKVIRNQVITCVQIAIQQPEFILRWQDKRLWHGMQIAFTTSKVGCVPAVIIGDQVAHLAHYKIISCWEMLHYLVPMLI